MVVEGLGEEVIEGVEVAPELAGAGADGGEEAGFVEGFVERLDDDVGVGFGFEVFVGKGGEIDGDDAEGERAGFFGLQSFAVVADIGGSEGVVTGIGTDAVGLGFIFEGQPEVAGGEWSRFGGGGGWWSVGGLGFGRFGVGFGQWGVVDNGFGEAAAVLFEDFGDIGGFLLLFAGELGALLFVGRGHGFNIGFDLADDFIERAGDGLEKAFFFRVHENRV